jgi:flagellar basal body-associated protein FliL
MEISKAINIKLVLFQLLNFFYQKGEFNMSKGRNILGVVSLIIALLATALGAYTFVFMNNYINALNAHIDELNSYIPPVASVYYDDISTYSISDQSSQIFNYNQISYDNRDAFNLTSDSYTIHEPGIIK